MAVSSVELIVNAAKAINPLRKVEQHSKKVDQALKKNQRAVKRVEAAFVLFGRKGANALRDLEGNAARLGKSMGGLRGGIVKAAVAFAGFKSIQVGIDRLESERRIKALAKSYGEAAQLQNAATAASKKFKISQTEANTALAGVFARLRPVGVSLKDIVSTYNGFNTAARISGATAVEASNAFTQLAQALGSGALRGDEFNSISEQVPGILTAISKETGIAQGGLRKYAAEGKITSDVVIKALKRIEAEGADQLTSALGGPAAKIKEFQNAIEDVQVAATESSIPAITDAISDLGTVIKQLEPAIRFIGGLLAGVAKTAGNIVENIAGGGKLAAAQLAANQAATLQARNKFGPLAREGITPGFKEFRDQVLERELSRRLAIARGAVPGQLPPSAADIGTTTPTPTPTPTPQPGPQDPDKEAERLKRIAAESAERVRSLEQQTLLAAALTGEEQKQFERQIQIADILENTRGLSDDQLRAELETTLALHEQQDATTAINKVNEDRLKLEKQQKKNADELADKYKQVGDAIKTHVTDSIMDAIDGTKSLGESALGILKDLGKQFLRLGINQAFGALGSTGGILGKLFGGGRASGGTVKGGTSYMVGERGPELFTPGRSGSIAPNNAMGNASVTVNVDASGSSVEGDGDQAAQLGKMLGAAVQAELVKQKRPGGLLAS